jgi:hypothetical protein
MDIYKCPKLKNRNISWKKEKCKNCETIKNFKMLSLKKKFQNCDDIFFYLKYELILKVFRRFFILYI